MSKNKIFYEAQLSCPEGRWGMTMTISRGDSTWTSPWFAFNGMKFQTFEEAREKAAEQFVALRTALEGPFKGRIDKWGVYGPKKRMTIKPDEGAWKCGNGHWFEYAPPPAWPPWCAIEGCSSPMLLWIVKDDVTSKDWPPYLPYSERTIGNEPVFLRPMTDGPPWIWPEGKPPAHHEPTFGELRWTESAWRSRFGDMRGFPWNEPNHEPYTGRHRKEGEEGEGELLPEVRPEDQ